MIDTSFAYQYEKLGDAVRILMIPVQSDAASISGAYHECFLAFKDFDREKLSEDGRRRLERMEELVEGEGSWEDRARELSRDQRSEFSRSVWELYAEVARRYFGEE